MAEAPKPSVTLRPMLPQDGPALATLFVASIEDLIDADYTPAQQAAWAGVADDQASFVEHLSGLLTLVASIAGGTVGFAALKAPDHIEMVYVHPEAVGQGVATALCNALETIARSRKVERLTVAASDTAQGFFAKRGYEARTRETVLIGDEWLGRTAMRKTLDTTPDTGP